MPIRRGVTMRKILLAPLALLLLASPAHATSGQVDVNGALAWTATTSVVPPNGIYSPSANQLNFVTNSATALTITSTGSVGIGSTAPQTNLYVLGAGYVEATFCCKYSAIFDTAGTFNV